MPSPGTATLFSPRGGDAGTDSGQEESIPDLQKIERAGRHLLELINNILDLSKIEAGRMEVFIEDVEIGPLVEEVHNIIAPLTAKNVPAVPSGPTKLNGPLTLLLPAA